MFKFKRGRKERTPKVLDGLDAPALARYITSGKCKNITLMVITLQASYLRITSIYVTRYELSWVPVSIDQLVISSMKAKYNPRCQHLGRYS